MRVVLRLLVSGFTDQEVVLRRGPKPMAIVRRMRARARPGYARATGRRVVLERGGAQRIQAPPRSRYGTLPFRGNPDVWLRNERQRILNESFLGIMTAGETAAANRYAEDLFERRTGRRPR